MALSARRTPERANPFVSGPIFQKFVPVTEATAAAVTFSPAQLMSGILNRDCAGAGRADLVPTAANLVAAIPGAEVGTSFDFSIRNTSGGAFSTTPTTNTGATLIGTMAVAQNNIKPFRVVLTNVTPGSEAYSLYSMAAAGAF